MSRGLLVRNRKSNQYRPETPRRGRRGRVELEWLEPRELLAAQPTAILSVPPRPMLGESMTFRVGFDNTSATDVGYGPFLDVVLPATGKDGDDGITFQSASYLGTSLGATVLTFDASGTVAHPFAKTSTGAPVIVTGTPGDQLVVLQLPFGSFTPEQPTATVDIQAMVSALSDVDQALDIQATGGFSLGNDPLDNPTTDPSILGPTVTSAASPTLVTLTKTYLGPEDETATGPSYHQRYQVTVDVASGQTVTDLDISDLLPANLQFVSVVGTEVHGVPTATTAISTPSTTTPGGTLTRRFASVTGDASTSDATMLFEFYVPQDDASGDPVLAPDIGAPATSVDQASSQVNWTPTDPRDPAGTFTSNSDTHTLNDRSLAIQKSVQGVDPSGPEGTVDPGNTLEYTINFQVSDFFALQSLVISDIISDGQRFDSTFTPTLSVNGNSYSLPTGDFQTGNYTVTGNYTGAVPPPASPDGTSTIVFNVSDEIIARGENGRLVGGMVSPNGGSVPFPGVGATTGVLVFRTTIQKTFSDVPAPGAVVGQGDILRDNVTSTAAVLNNDSLETTGNQVADGSQAQIEIAAGTLQKSIYAVNGDTNVGVHPQVTAGDVVTYRLVYTLPNSNFRELTLEDFLPLPIFAANTVTSFQSIVSAGAPPSGTAKYGPSDTFSALSGLTPTLSTDSVSNSVRFAWPQYINPDNVTSVVDILFSVTASGEPFADQLLLTNQARATESTSNNEPVVDDQIVQLIMTEPVLGITKGVVATNAPTASFTGPVGPVNFSAPGSSGYRGSAAITSDGLAANPVDANLNGVQAGDLVTFAIVIQNTGTGPNGAFDVRFHDTLPAGFVVPSGGLNLSVTDGTGASISTTDLGGGLFGDGLQLVDPGPTSDPAGALDPYDATSGRNIVIVTYDLQVVSDIAPSTTITNTGSLSGYASIPDGPDFLANDLTDTASVTALNVGVDKQITATDQAFTDGSDLAIGEVATYTVVMTIPQGVTSNASMVDTLPDGLAIVALDSLTTNDPTHVSFSAGTLAQILGAATVAEGGFAATFQFGDITNTDTDDTTAETITAVVRVVALNVQANTNGRTQTNTAQFSYTGGSSLDQATAGIVVPLLDVTKTVDDPEADANSVVTYTITLAHDPESGTDAFDVEISDLIPAEVTYVPGSWHLVSGLAPTTIGDSGALTATYDSFPKGSTATFAFQGTVASGVAAYQTVTNTADVQYTSLSDTTSGPISPYNPNSVERTGDPNDPGGVANDLNGSGSASFTPTPSLSKTILDTDQSFTLDDSVAVGEQVRYRVVITVPRGVSPDSVLADTLPSGLALVSVDAITPTSDVTTSVDGGFDAVRAGALVGEGGSSVTFDFGTLTNSATDSSPRSVAIDYTVVVLNVAGNVSGTTLANQAVYQTGGGSTSASAPSVGVVVPLLGIAKSIDPTTGDAGGTPLTVRLTVQHAQASTIDAFNVVVTDSLPAGMSYVQGSLQVVSGQQPTSAVVQGSTVVATYDQLPLGASTVLSFQVLLNESTTPGQTVTNLAQMTYTSLPGEVLTPVSPYNPNSTERTGNPEDPGGGVNDLAAGDDVSITLNSSSLAGTTYVDANNDGIIQPTETRVPGVTVTLTGTDNLGNAVTRTATTDELGNYEFTGLRPGSYTLTQTQPAGYLSGKNTVGSQGGTAETPPSNIFANLVLPLGVSTEGIGNNFGEIIPSSLAGTVYVDMNLNGTQDPGEPGLPGVTITLSGTDDLGPVSTVLTTDANGQYVFGDLRPGTYTITETQPQGFVSTQNTIGTQGGTIGPNDNLTDIVLGQGVHGTGNNFGEFPAGGSLSGSVYWDLNHNGEMDSADFGIVNVTVTLTGVDDLGNPVNLATKTDAQGAYEFSNLRPGTYSIIETQPRYFRDFRDNLGTLGGQVGKDKFTSIVVPTGGIGQNYNFGELQLRKFRLRCLAVSVGDRVARDQEARARDPERFDRDHPKVGSLLANGQVPRGVGGYPHGPLAYSLVPTLGTKRIVEGTDPVTGWRGLVGIPNFPSLLSTKARRRR